MSTLKKLSLIIVNYNSTDQLSKLLLSTKFIKEIINEIIIIDNNSNDFKKFNNKFKKIKIIKNTKNLGFSKAVNQGIKVSKNNYILLINPDSLIIDKSIIEMYDFIKKTPSIGAIGGKIRKMNENKYHFTANLKPTFLTGLFEFTNLKKIFPNNIFSKMFWPEIEYKNRHTPIEVDALCGAFMIFKKWSKNKLNLFNEKYFLYLEDLDFGINIKNIGEKVIFFPKATIKHIGGYSSKSKYKIVLKYWYKSRKIFFRDHLSKFASIILNIIFTIEEISLHIYHLIKHEPTK